MLKKILEILKIIFLFKFDFFLPGKKKFLLFDDNHKNYLLRYIKREDLDVLHIRKEKINFIVVVINFLKLKFSFKEYIEAYIDIVAPKFIISFSDNNCGFFLIKKRKEIKKLLIQNSWKNKYNDSFLSMNNENFNVDYLFVFNRKIGEIYGKILKCDPIIIGSFKSNCYELAKKKTIYPIIFISSFRNIKPSELMIDRITYKEYDKNHKQAVKEISDFAIKNKVKLYIYGNDQFYPLKEKKYFEQLNLKSDWEFINNNRPETYNIIDQADFIVGTHSTAIYEAIGRNKKVFIFSKNFNNQILNTHKFGWPYDFGKEGFFWVNNFSNKDSIQKKITMVFNLNQLDWDKKIWDIRGKLMDFDYGNKKFINLIN